MGPRRILVVDDDRDLVESLRAVLEEAGHLVSVASDGDGALLACPSSESRGLDPPELVLLDLHLGGSLAGRPLLESLRHRLPPETRVVVVSGEPDLPQRAAGLGADGCLEKPFSIERLLQLVDEMDRLQRRHEGEAAPSPA